MVDHTAGGHRSPDALFDHLHDFEHVLAVADPGGHQVSGTHLGGRLRPDTVHFGMTGAAQSY